MRWKRRKEKRLLRKNDARLARAVAANTDDTQTTSSRRHHAQPEEIGYKHRKEHRHSFKQLSQGFPSRWTEKRLHETGWIDQHSENTPPDTPTTSRPSASSLPRSHRQSPKLYTRKCAARVRDELKLTTATIRCDHSAFSDGNESRSFPSVSCGNISEVNSGKASSEELEQDFFTRTSANELSQSPSSDDDNNIFDKPSPVQTECPTGIELRVDLDPDTNHCQHKGEGDINYDGKTITPGKRESGHSSARSAFSRSYGKDPHECNNIRYTEPDEEFDQGGYSAHIHDSRSDPGDDDGDTYSGATDHNDLPYPNFPRKISASANMRTDSDSFEDSNEVHYNAASYRIEHDRKINGRLEQPVNSYYSASSASVQPRACFLF